MDTLAGEPFVLFNGLSSSPLLVVCEHACNFVPEEFNALGLSRKALNSHIAWDPGAFAVAHTLSKIFNAKLLASGISRLVYDCNRPPQAPDAIPKRSETYDIPGNTGLTAAQKTDRTERFYDPFNVALMSCARGVVQPLIIVTIHSFAPVYLGKPRAVEIGILHDTDTRLADEMLRLAPNHTRLKFARNQPYSAADGVTHTLKISGVELGHLNVMIEIRNDLIATNIAQAKIAGTLADILMQALTSLQVITGQESPS